jgi:hypothetical protein
MSSPLLPPVDLAKARATFPANFQCAMPIDKLIEAGFQYRGGGDKTKGDNVKCHYCGGKLYGWKYNDDPMKLHRKYYPKCPFVIAAADKKTEDNASKPPPTQHAYATIVSIAQQLGYSVEHINKAITACRHNYTQVEIGNVLDQLAQYDDDDNVDIDTDIPHCSSSSSTTDAPYAATNNTSTTTAPTTNYLLDMTCKVCMNNCIQYVFLTCRHACCCDNCALTIMDHRDCQCPVCNNKITSSLRIYFA